MLPLQVASPLGALALGAGFGIALQRAGLGDGCKLTGQLRLEDWTVFNVMMTAIVVAASGLWLLDATGLMMTGDVFIPATPLVLALLGGALVGVGMALGGYCPGTSVVAAMAGRFDGAAFFGGIVMGTLLFAGLYERLEPWMAALSEPTQLTLPALWHVRAPLLIALLAAVAWAVGFFTSHRAADSTAGQLHKGIRSGGAI